MKSVGAVVADGVVGLFTPCLGSTDIPYIDNDHPVFGLHFPMIQHIVNLPPHERGELSKPLSDGYIMGLHGELAAKGVRAVFEM